MDLRRMIDSKTINLIPNIDISTPENLNAFKKWQNEDGTLEGLQKLYEEQENER